MSTDRFASKPSAGAARGGLVGLLAGLAATWAVQQTGNPDAGPIAAALVTSVLVAAGKVARNAGHWLGRFV